MWCWFYNIVYILTAISLIGFGAKNITDDVCSPCGFFFIILGIYALGFFGKRCLIKKQCGKFPEEQE